MLHDKIRISKKKTVHSETLTFQVRVGALGLVVPPVRQAAYHAGFGVHQRPDVVAVESELAPLHVVLHQLLLIVLATFDGSRFAARCFGLLGSTKPTS